MAIDGRGGPTPGAFWDVDVPLDSLQMLWRVATWEYDPETDHVYWLDSPTDTLGLDEETAELLVEPILVSLRHGAPWEHFDLERSVDDQEGTTIDVRMQARRLEALDAHREPGCVGVAVDISEQRRTERSLRGLIDRYRRLVELSPDIIAVHQQGVIRYVNPTGVRMAKVSGAGELIGRPILDFLHPASIEETMQRIAALTEPGMASAPSPVVILTPDGTAVAMESVSVRTEWEGEPAFQVILRDITERRRAEAALRFQASLVRHVSDAVIATDPEGRITAWNPAAETLYGRAAAEVLHRSVADVLGSSAVDEDGLLLRGRVDHRTADGRARNTLVSVANLRDELGDDAGVVAMCADLTDRLEREAAEALFTAAVAALDEGVVVVDVNGLVVSVNASARSLLGEWLAEGVHVSEIVSRYKLVSDQGGALPPEEHPLAVGFETGRQQRLAVVGIIDGDRPLWLSMNVQAIEALSGASRFGDLVWSFCDLTERKRAEERLRFQATHDPLTRLPNRGLCLVNLTDALIAARTDSVPMAVLWIDLDHFKSLNDSLGRAVGDTVLMEVAARLRSKAGPRDSLGRLAGDEFLVGSPGIRSVEEAREIAEGLASEISRPMPIGRGREIVVTVSIGVTLTDSRRVSPEDVLAEADIALYLAKDRGRARIEVFDDRMRSTLTRRLAVEEGLRRAIGSNSIYLKYQPIVAVHDGHLVGVEALARWNDELLGEVEPSEFIPVAEETGMMIPLGTALLRRACEAAARWKDRAGPDQPVPTMSVNVSPRQLMDPTFVETVTLVLDETGIDPDRLWLEVTESVLVEETYATSQTLSSLRERGVHFSIDDFGTGYSSLGYLKRLPVEALKIDRSFVAGLGTDAESEAIVEAIVRLGQALHLQTIAEGVETESQVARLRELGCDLVQGFLFSPPIGAAELRLQRWITSRETA